MSSNLAAIVDNERKERAVSPAAEPTSLALSGNTAGPVEGDNIENGGNEVGGDASDFGRGAANMISNIGDGDREKDRVIKGGDIDDKDYIFLRWR